MILMFDCSPEIRRMSSCILSSVTKPAQYTAEKSGEVCAPTACVEDTTWLGALLCAEAPTAAKRIPKHIVAAFARIIIVLLRLTPERAVRGLAPLKLTSASGHVNKLRGDALHFSKGVLQALFSRDWG